MVAVQQQFRNVGKRVDVQEAKNKSSYMYDAMNPTAIL